MHTLLTIRYFFLICLSSNVAATMTAGDAKKIKCAALLTNDSYIEEVSSIGRMRDLAVEWRMEKSGKHLLIDGIPAEKYAATGHHDNGVKNMGIFKFNRTGAPRILKVFKESDPSFALEGMIVAQKVGGPKIFKVGLVQWVESGKEDFAVEMEELFPGVTSHSFKGLLNAKELGFLTDKNDSMHTYSQIIAENLVTSFNQRIFPIEDVDFLIFDRQMRWIDTGSWRSYVDLRLDDNALDGLEGYLYAIHAFASSDVFKAVVSDLRSALNHLSLSEEDSKRVKTRFEYLSNRWGQK